MRCACGAVGEDEERVVGGGVAVDADGIEGPAVCVTERALEER